MTRSLVKGNETRTVTVDGDIVSAFVTNNKTGEVAPLIRGIRKPTPVEAHQFAQRCVATLRRSGWH